MPTVGYHTYRPLGALPDRHPWETQPSAHFQITGLSWHKLASFIFFLFSVVVTDLMSLTKLAQLLIRSLNDKTGTTSDGKHTRRISDFWSMYMLTLDKSEILEQILNDDFRTDLINFCVFEECSYLVPPPKEI